MIHADRVYGALRRFGLDPAEADEVAQEVFVRAWRGLPGSRSEPASRPGCIGSPSTKRSDGCHAVRHRARETIDPDRDDPVVSLPESPRLGPEAQTLDREFERTLDRALDELPPDWRSAVVLRDIEGLSTERRPRSPGSARPRSRAACIAAGCNCEPSSSHTSGSRRAERRG